MSRGLYFVVPGPLSTRTGGYIYDRRIVAGLKAFGRRVEVIELRGGYPFPGARDRDEALDMFRTLSDGARVVVDGLAFGALPEVVEDQRDRLRLIALVHHPLADETGLEPSQTASLHASETRALAVPMRIIVTSNFTRRRLAAFGVADEKVCVVMPGTDPVPQARGSGGANVLLCPASFIPRKGHRDLLRALAGLTELPWSLVCAGKMDANPACAAEARALCLALALSQRVSLRDQVGESELARLYEGTDLLVLASHYEGFGMVVQEAVARGIPVITTTGGALEETLPPGAGLASAPGDVTALQENLRRVLSDRALYLTLAEGARRARRSQPTWQDAAAAFDAALRDLP